MFPIGISKASFEATICQSFSLSNSVFLIFLKIHFSKVFFNKFSVLVLNLYPGSMDLHAKVLLECMSNNICISRIKGALFPLECSNTVPGSDLWQPQQVEGRYANQGEWKACLCLSDLCHVPLLDRGLSDEAVDIVNTAFLFHSPLLLPLLPPNTGCVCLTQVFSGNETF